MEWYIGNFIKQLIIYYLIPSDVIEQTIGLILLCKVIVSVFKVVLHQFPYLFPPVRLMLSTSTHWVDIVEI